MKKFLITIIDDSLNYYIITPVTIALQGIVAL